MTNNRALLRSPEAQAALASALGRIRGIRTVLEDIDAQRAVLIQERSALVCRLWGSGASQAEIVEATGLTNARVSQIVAAGRKSAGRPQTTSM